MGRIVKKEEVNNIAFKIVGCAIEVHSQLGPGLLESVYHECLLDELRRRGLIAESQVQVPINYKGKVLAHPLIIDILVNDLVIIEIKVVETIHPVHKAQLLSYLKLTGKPKGLLINFHTDKLVNGITHMVSEKFASLPVETP